MLAGGGSYYFIGSSIIKLDFLHKKNSIPTFVIPNEILDAVPGIQQMRTVLNESLIREI